VTARGFIIAAPRSSSGKTTVTLGVLAALRRRKIAVRAAKAGPDYIDPAFHAAATGAPGINLDSWAMPPSLIGALLADAGQHADTIVIEGAMGLFDGVPTAAGRSGAAADLAARFHLPVILVLDVSGQSQSAAAIASGFSNYDPGVRVAGVILNKVGSERHRTLVSDAMAAIRIPVLGSIPRDETLVLPERHLGLVQASEHGDLAARLNKLADMAEKHIDLDALLAAASSFGNLDGAATSMLPPPGQRIALASDAAFTFMYAHLLDGWRRAGAEIKPFSPLDNEPPPPDCDVCWLPGGYPELYAGVLASAKYFREGLAHFAETKSIHGECGGHMVLGEGLEDAKGVRHAMTGLLSHSTSFAKRRLHLGYREARLLSDGVIGKAGDVVRGHEFHHASIIDEGRDEAFAEMTDAQGRAVAESGSRRGRVSGTFFHAIARAG
jgi:cobyrinic acid a,c-diamide synthase